MPWLGAPPADVALATSDLNDDIVTESKMANDAIGLTELKAGTDGELITWDASGNPVAVGAGSSGEFLKSQGAGSVPVFAAAAGGNLVYAENTGTATIASTTYADIGNGYSVSITPKTTSSKILVMALVRHQANWGALLMNYIRILDADDTVHGEAGEIARDGGSTAGTFHTTLFCIDEPGSTSEQTYRVQSKNYGSVTAYIGEGGDSQMIAMEI
jgi:hypothetical protein